MARRGRGAAAARPDTAVDGAVGAMNGAMDDSVNDPDQPGARTIGALAVARWAARKAGEPSDDAARGLPTADGPWDEDDLDVRRTVAGRVDFGAVQIPVPRGGRVSVEPEEGRLQAVHVMLPTGRLSVSALAAPRTGRLWPDLAAEIDESLREGGATVRSFNGVWGRELHARTGEASSVFVGVDGPRWMLYGVATGPTSSAAELDEALRQMLRGTVVIRGRLPYPVRTVLPLTVPEHLAPENPTTVDGTGSVPAARTAEPSNRAPARPAAAPMPPRNGAALERPAGPPSGAPRALSGPPALSGSPALSGVPALSGSSTPAGPGADVPTEPHGLPRVAAGPTHNGRAPYTNGSGWSGVTGVPAGPQGAAPNGSSAGRYLPETADPAPHRPTRTPAERIAPPEHMPPARTAAEQVDRDAGRNGQRRVADLVAESQRANPVTQTGQRRVAELLADAERERRAAQEARAARAARVTPPESHPGSWARDRSAPAPSSAPSPAAWPERPPAAPPEVAARWSGGVEDAPSSHGVDAGQWRPGTDAEQWRPGTDAEQWRPGAAPAQWAGTEAPSSPSGAASPASWNGTVSPAPYDDIALLRLGGAPQARDDGARDDGFGGYGSDGRGSDGRGSDSYGSGSYGSGAYGSGADGSGYFGAGAGSAGSTAGDDPRRPTAGRDGVGRATVADGSADWTVPMSIVPSEPTSPPQDPAQRAPRSDLWADDPWAAEVRRTAAAAPRPAHDEWDHPPRGRRHADQGPGAQRPGVQGPGVHGRGDPGRGDPRHGDQAYGGREYADRGYGERGHERSTRQPATHQRPAHHRPAHEQPGHRPAHEHPGVGSAVDVPAARVPPPVPAWARLVDGDRHERTDPFDGPPPGRHHRPDR